MASNFFPSGAVFTVAPGSVTSGRDDKPANHQSFDLAVVEFNDDGSLVDARQKQAVVDCITAARRFNPNGVLVVVFIHGWHHTARFGDTHFVGFRKILMSLAYREMERSAGRRVIGVYLAWQGDPESWIGVLRETWLTHLSFFGRYRAAKRIGDGDALRNTLREIVSCTKGPPPPETQNQPQSPLALVGHSMGGLMLESALLALLINSDTNLIKTNVRVGGCVAVKRGDEFVSLPDVVISLNSAADSRTTKALTNELERQELSKSVSYGEISYSPPLFISATSTNDWATKVIWRLAPFNLFRRTGGHDRTLFTHIFDTLELEVLCAPKPRRLDFGQSWSCLRLPHPPGVPSPGIPIDLPERSRSDGSAGRDHTRYLLSPIGEHEQKYLAWIFQLPPRISAEHNDIFNSRCSLLVLALMQISGAVMSLAEDWSDNFEPLPH